MVRLLRIHPKLRNNTLSNSITASAPNNGSYTWRGDKFDSALVSGYTHGALSGCNYSIELKVWTNVIYSDYFTVINPDDGGLESSSECPSADAAIGPTNQTCK